MLIKKTLDKLVIVVFVDENRRKGKADNMKGHHIYLGIALLALGLLSTAQGVRATESSEFDSSTNPVGEPFSEDAHVSLRVPWQSRDDFSLGAVAESSGGEESASELNRKLTNPVSDIWSISNQFNNFELNNGHWNNNWLFQPVPASS